MSFLNMQRPVVFFDLETTGVSVSQDRIVEISCLKINPDLAQKGITQRVNPLMPIPEEASNVHGITDKDVASCPTFNDIYKDLFAFIDGCDLAGFNNIRYDIPLLVEEFLRAGVELDLSSVNVIDAQVIFHKNEQRDLSSALKFYCDRTLEGAHAAENDIVATWDIFKAQVSRYGLTDMASIAKEYVWSSDVIDYAGKFVRNENGDAVFSFGKHKGHKLSDNPGYCRWMLDNDFTLNTKSVLRKSLNGTLR